MSLVFTILLNFSKVITRPPLSLSQGSLKARMIGAMKDQQQAVHMVL